MNLLKSRGVKVLKIIYGIIAFGAIAIAYITYFFGDSTIDKQKTLEMLFTVFNSHALLMAILWGIFVFYLLITFSNIINEEIKKGKLELGQAAMNKYNELHVAENERIKDLQRILGSIDAINQQSEVPLKVASIMLIREVIIPKLFTREELKEAIKEYPYFNLTGLRLFGFDEELIQIIVVENNKRQLEFDVGRLKSEEKKLEKIQKPYTDLHDAVKKMMDK